MGIDLRDQPGGFSLGAGSLVPLPPLPSVALEPVLDLARESAPLLNLLVSVSVKVSVEPRLALKLSPKSRSAWFLYPRLSHDLSSQRSAFFHLRSL